MFEALSPVSNRQPTIMLVRFLAFFSPSLYPSVFISLALVCAIIRIRCFVETVCLLGFCSPLPNRRTHLAADTLSLLLNGYDLTQSGGETDEGDAQTTTCFEPRNGNRGIDLVQVCLVC